MLLGQYFKNLNPTFKNHFFSGVSFNSKKCKKNNIFFAIRGTALNGNKYIQEAIKNGARTIISDLKFKGYKNKVLYLRSKDTRQLLAEISQKLFLNKPKKIVAVTGTNGKSSIANFYYQIFKLNNKRVASIGTLGIHSNNNKVSLSNTTIDPIKLGKILVKLKKREKINNVILEASSHGLKQKRLDGIQFDTGIFTNLSHDHLDYHKSIRDYLNSKLYLFEKLLKRGSKIITDNEISEFRKIKKISIKRKLKLKTILNNKASITLLAHKYLGENQFIKIKYKKKNYSFLLNLIGKMQIKNVLMAMLAAEEKNFTFDKIVSTANKIKPVHGRIEKIGKLKNNSIVILDFAHTPDALKETLKNLKEQFHNREISIVFGCGGNRDRLKRPSMGSIANKYCSKIYLTDDNPRFENPQKIRNEIKKNILKSKVSEISNRKEAINNAVKNLKTGGILLVAGKGHETTQDYGKSKRFFSDKKEIMKSIRTRNKSLANNLKVNILNEENKSGNLIKNTLINHASINSKKIKKNDIFFAIKGKKLDGNFFTEEALNKRASVAFVNKIKNIKNKKKQIKVNNVLKFLTKVSKTVRENFEGQIIGITGSCGKTSVKELLGETLNKFSSVTFSPKSYNNKYGVPLSLFNLNLKGKYGVFEIGMDKKGEIDFLSKIVNPDVGVITNVSYAHAKNFKNINQIASAKGEIINNIKDEGFLVLNAEDNFFETHKKIALKKKIKIVSFSTKKNGIINLKNITRNKQKYKLSILIDDKTKYFYVKSNYSNYIKNILATISVLYCMNCIQYINPYTFYKNSIPDGRGDLSIIKFKNKKINLIDESYNSNPLSLSSAIKNFDSINVINKRKHLLLGDMLELGKHSKKLHKNIAKRLNSSSIGKINIIGKDIKETYKKLLNKKKGVILKNTSQIFNLIINNLNSDDYLMIKGSNSTGLNRYTKILKRKN